MANVGEPDKVVYPKENEYEQGDLIPVRFPERKEEKISVPNWPVKVPVKQALVVEWFT